MHSSDEYVSNQEHSRQALTSFCLMLTLFLVDNCGERLATKLEQSIKRRLSFSGRNNKFNPYIFTERKIKMEHSAMFQTPKLLFLEGLWYILMAN